MIHISRHSLLTLSQPHKPLSTSALDTKYWRRQKPHRWLTSGPALCEYTHNTREIPQLLQTLLTGHITHENK